MSTTSSNISELRERTGAGIVDCKKALEEAGGDLTKATEILRQKGIASAANKSGKVAAEGAVKAQVSGDGKKGVLVELNSQTDFVAKNEKFQSLLNQIIEIALSSKVNTVDDLASLKTASGDTVANLIALKTAEIGEKLDLRRLSVIEASADEKIYEYTHPVGSRIAVLVKLTANNDQIGKDVAMHIAASQPAPEYLDRSEISEDIIENERRIELGKEDLANKPKEIAEKIVTGRVEKALMEKVLLEQPFVKNPSEKIKDYLQKNKLDVVKFVRFNLGEGIEKKESNFAEEVAAQTKR
ncbi:MAG: translation elongation factor Ts [Candidatus Caenarcaniphilales bacterium]|nr:translation elongation factor Ts [Candidatus Caenarcaniphilales bacterium]